MLYSFLEKIIKRRSLGVIDASGQRHHFGDGPAEVVVRIHSRITELALLARPHLALGEAYMDGLLTIEKGSLYDLLDILGENRTQFVHDRWFSAVWAFPQLFRWMFQYNPLGRSVRNVAHHYNLSDQLYELFLDEDRQYTCAYFEHPSDSLEQAQRQKMDHLAKKLLLSRSSRVLDLGCGWGGLAIRLAKMTGCHVTGITLSENQLRYAEQRALQEGLDDRVEFQLCDYRDVRGNYDRIISVGMLEHVGTKQYEQFFGVMKNLLTEDGVAVVHSMGRMEPPSYTSGWIAKYIFPGGYIPALSETLRAIERYDLLVTDIEILRSHYVLTLQEWRRRFAANRAAIADLYDERFCRMWEFYLATAQSSFVHWRLMVFQIQLSLDKEAVPVTRNYMGRAPY